MMQFVRVLSGSLERIPPWFGRHLSHLGWRTTTWGWAGAYRDPAGQPRLATRDHWLLVVICRGRVRIAAQGQAFMLADGHAAILPPGSSHTMTCQGMADLVARFPVIAMSDRPIPRNPLACLPPPAPLPLADARLALEQVQALVPQPPGGDAFAWHRARDLLVGDLLLNALAGGFAAGRLPDEDPQDWPHAAQAWLGRHLHDPAVTIGDCADALGIGRSELQRRFAEVYGQSPKAWLHGQRIALARRLLMDKHRHTIGSVMRQCGYRDRTTFLRRFKAVTGTSPAASRRRSPPATT